MNFSKVGNNPNAQCKTNNDCNRVNIPGFECGPNNTCQCGGPKAWNNYQNNCYSCDASRHYIRINEKNKLPECGN